MKAAMLLALSLLVACTSLHKRAQTYFDAEDYEAAANTYQEILRGEPGNQDAQLGLRKSREKWIDQKLVQTRLLRMGGNATGAADLLAKIYVNEVAWDLFPKGAVAFTQEEESRLAAVAIAEDVRKAAREEKPVKAMWLLSKYRNFYQGERKSLYGALERDTKAAGKAQCKALALTLKNDQFYYGQFVRRFCETWGEKAPTLAVQRSYVQNEMYGEPVIELELKGFSEAHRIFVANGLKEKWKTSPWFDPAGKKTFRLAVQGAYHYAHQERTETLTHAYSVKVPYTHEWIEAKTEQNSQQKSDVSAALDTAVTLISLFTNTPGSGRTVRDNGNGTVTVSETRYRDEPHTYEYAARRHSQKFGVSFEATGRLQDETVALSHEKRQEHQSIAHDNSMEEIGLFPRKPDLIPESQWIQLQAEELVSRFQARLKDQWTARYCRPGLYQADSGPLREAGFRCLRLDGSEPGADFTAWFNTQVGVSVAEAVAVLGRFH
ncbi:MAG TPA: hypothetical protein VFV50_19610 [Bdellovibrionales bacterium]|nr:hypothetical protein [Bdellovibrionales bacterium]